MRTLILAAHPDDEILFLYPAIQERTADTSLLVCSSDENNQQRAWCRRRKEALSEICRMLGLHHECLSYDSEFSRLPHRPTNDLCDWWDTVVNCIRATKPDVIWTHNQWGEYGHFDHRLLHWLVRDLGIPLATTDIRIPLNWPLERDAAKPESMRLVERDGELFARCRAIYEGYGCWTWDFVVPSVCGVIE